MEDNSLQLYAVFSYMRNCLPLPTVLEGLGNEVTVGFITVTEE